MRIDRTLRDGQTVSFEVFPPKPELDPDLSGIKRTLADLGAAQPDFVSVTYGAGGNNRPRALDIARMVLSLGMRPLSHLTAVGYRRDDTAHILKSLEELGVDNILALRGDIPQDASDEGGHWKDYRRGSDLIWYVSGNGGFCIGGAAYPEGHQQSVSTVEDVAFMEEKVRAGVTFFITQLFFDNGAFYRFMERVRNSEANVPVLAGIMPVLRAGQIRRIVEISGCRVPEKLDRLLTKYESDDDSMREAGVDYAAEQIADLWKNGVDGIHLYTMNKSRGALDILKRCNLSRGGRRA